jgi:hypothetical protein
MNEKRTRNRMNITKHWYKNNFKSDNLINSHIFYSKRKFVHTVTMQHYVFPVTKSLLMFYHTYLKQLIQILTQGVTILYTNVYGIV